MYGFIETVIPLTIWGVLLWGFQKVLAGGLAGKRRMLWVICSVLFFLLGPALVNVLVMDLFWAWYRSMEGHPYPSWDIALTHRFTTNGVLLYTVTLFVVIRILRKRKS